MDVTNTRAITQTDQGATDASQQLPPSKQSIEIKKNLSLNMRLKKCHGFTGSGGKQADSSVPPFSLTVAKRNSDGSSKQTSVNHRSHPLPSIQTSSQSPVLHKSLLSSSSSRMIPLHSSTAKKRVSSRHDESVASASPATSGGSSPLFAPETHNEFLKRKLVSITQANSETSDFNKEFADDMKKLKDDVAKLVKKKKEESDDENEFDLPISSKDDLKDLNELIDKNRKQKKKLVNS